MNNNWIKQLEALIGDGLHNDLIYNRLVLTKSNFAKTPIRKLNLYGIDIEVLEGFAIDKDYLIDMSKAKYTGGSIKSSMLLSSFMEQGVIKEIVLNVE